MVPLSQESFTVLDLETTGGRPESNGILEIGMVRIENCRIADKFSSLVNPGFPIPPIVRKMTGITGDMVADAPHFEVLADPILDFVDCSILVVHNGPFDLQFLNFYLEQQGRPRLLNPSLCTVKLGEKLLPEAPNRRLETLAQYLGIPLNGRHRAWGDAQATAQIFLAYLRILEEKGIRTLPELFRYMNPRPVPAPPV